MNKKLICVSIYKRLVVEIKICVFVPFSLYSDHIRNRVECFSCCAFNVLFLLIDAILPTTPCAQNFYLNAGRFEQCFVPLYNMHFLNSFTSLAAVNGFDLQHTFKCR